MVSNSQPIEKPTMPFRRLPYIAVFLVGVLISIVSFLIIQDWQLSLTRAEFEFQANNNIASVQRDIDNYVEIIDSIGGLFYSSDKVEPNEFRKFVGKTLKRHPDIQALGWIPKVDARYRDNFLAETRSSGLSGFEIIERNAAGQLIKATGREHYYPVYYMEPIKGNETALGFDLASNPVRMKALHAARDSGEMVITDRIMLVQEKADQYGVLFVLPLYAKESKTDTIEARQQNLIGFITGVFRIGDLIESAIHGGSNSGADYLVFDGGAESEQGYLYFHTNHKDQEHSKVHDIIKDTATLKSQYPFTYEASIRVPGREWGMVFAPDEKFMSAYTNLWSWFVLVTGLSITFLATAYFRNILRGKSDVEQRASELAHSKESLQRRYQKLFENTSDAIIVSTLEDGIIDCNQAALKMFGYENAEDFFGQKPHELNPPRQPDGSDSLTLAEQLIEETIQKGSSQFEWLHRRKNGEDFLTYISLTTIEIDNKLHLAGNIRDITEERKTQNALQRESEFADSLIETAQAIVLVMDTEGRIVRFNPYMEKIAGYKLEEVKGKSCFDIFLPEEQREQLRAIFDDAIADIQTKGNVNYLVTKDGKLRIIEWYDKTLKDTAGKVVGLLSMGQDVTERTIALKDLEANEEQFRTLVDNIPGMVYRCELDADWTVHFMSEAMFELSGYPASDFLQRVRSYASIIHPDDVQMVEDVVMKAVGNHQSYVIEYRIIDANDNIRWVYEKGRAVYDESGNPLWLDGAIFDITEKKKAEQEIIVARDQAEQASQAKSTFLSRMSHELRTPLNSILGFGQLLDNSKEVIQPREQLYVEQILQSGWHLLDLISELLDLAKIEENKVELFMEPVDVSERILNCINVIKPLAQARGITIDYDLDASRDLFVNADQIRLKQVLLNLLSNAVKYNREQGSITIAYAIQDNGKLRISVTDTGSGVAEADIPVMFEPFSRLYLKGHAEGAGIGLTISSQLMALMGGEIGVDSVLGKGSTFWIELESAEGQPKEQTPEPYPDNVLSLSKNPVRYKILYIEDSPSHVKLVEQILASHAGTKLIHAPTPKLGLELARTHKPDIILLDICLPGMDGFQVFNELRKYSDTADIPVMALSANAMPNEIEKGLRLGFRRYLTKPININEFKKAINELLNDKVV